MLKNLADVARFNLANGTRGVEYIKLDEQGRDNMGVPLFDFNVQCVIEVSPVKVRFW